MRRLHSELLVHVPLACLLLALLAPGAALAEAPSAVSYQESDVLPSVNVMQEGSDAASLRVGGTIQLWAIPMLGEDALLDNGDAGNAPGFRLRRARLGMKGTFPKYVTMELTLNPLDPHHMVHDANITYQPMAEIGLVLGAAKVPYSRFQLDSSSKLRFYDRPMGTGEVSMDHRLGAALQGSIADGMLSYVAGVYNAADGSFGSGNTARGVLYGGRLESAPMGALASLTPEDFRIRFGGGAVYEDGSTQDTLAYSGDLLLEGYRVQLRGEYLKDVRTPDADPILPPTLNAEVERQSIVAELTAFILTDRLEAALRYETYDSNLEVEDFGDANIYVGGLNGYIYGHSLKVILNYIYREETGGAKLDNDALILSFGGAI